MKCDLERESAVAGALRQLAQATPEPPPNPEAEGKLLDAFDAAWARPSTPPSASLRAGRSRRRPVLGRIVLTAALAASAVIVAFVRVRLTPDATAIHVRTSVDDRRMTTLDADAGAGRRRGDPDRGSGLRFQVDPRILGNASVDAHTERPPSVRSIEERRRNRSFAAARRQFVPRRRPAPIADEPTDFVPWPGAIALPPLESGAFVRIDLPASVLPSLGVQPPPHPGVVQADILVGQDGFARAIRLVPINQQQE